MRSLLDHGSIGAIGRTGSSYRSGMGKELVAYFFEREDAEEVARRLAADDLTARRERFHALLGMWPEGDVRLLAEMLARFNGLSERTGNANRG